MGILDSVVKIVALSTAEKITKVSAETLQAYIQKEKTIYVYTPKSASEFLGKDYEEVVTELEAHGFDNIHLIEKRDLKNNWFYRGDNRKIVEISIDGKKEFRTRSKFLPEVRVVITYHTFKERRTD